MLNTVRPVEVPDEPLIPIRQLATTSQDPCPEQFISTLFLVEKGPGKGEFRPVINLKAPNRFLPKEKFKMERLHTTCSLLRRGDFMMKLDLKDAYNAVPIHPESRKYLWFYHEGRTRILLPSFQPFTGSLLLHQNPPSHHSKTVLRGNTNSNLLV